MSGLRHVLYRGLAGVCHGVCRVGKGRGRQFRAPVPIAPYEGIYVRLQGVSRTFRLFPPAALVVQFVACLA